jgi:hypothetical protein
MNSSDDISNNVQIPVNTEHEKKIQLRHLQEERLKLIQTESVNMVCRQTDYDENTAREKLEIANYNYEIVLNEFYGITNKNPDSNITKNNITTNQQIYGEIRNLMDIGARKFRINQENAELYKKTMSKVD